MTNNTVEKKYVIQWMNYDKDQYEYLKITTPERAVHYSISSYIF